MKIRHIENYKPDPTDSQWNLIDDLLNDKRHRKYEIRDIIQGISICLKRVVNGV